jgi:CPA2 family monovalent cation:H+ antiporter-2
MIVRTRFVTEVAPLYKLGANEVVPEEFETSIELFTRTLRSYLAPRHLVDELARELRKEGYETFRAADPGFRPIEGLRRLLGDVEFEAFGVGPGSELVGRTLAETQIKQRTGALVLAVHREHTTLPNPAADFTWQVDDVALILGPPAALARAGELFHGP